eukprot:6690530-Pyramimonas_sp.AAC.1
MWEPITGDRVHHRGPARGVAAGAAPLHHGGGVRGVFFVRDADRVGGCGWGPARGGPLQSRPGGGGGPAGIYAVEK